MTDGPNNHPGTIDAGEILAGLVGMFVQAVPVNPQLLFGLNQEELQTQFAEGGYTRILADLVDERSRVSHPIWGFYIQSARPAKDGSYVEIARTEVPKVLDTSAKDYLAQLAGWTNTYMLATTPACRAAWRAAGWQVHFFQKERASDNAPNGKSKLKLVKP